MLSHVAVLVPSVRHCAEKLAPYGFDFGEVEEFPSEGTRELYVGAPAASGSLLLMEAIGPGPYDRAKRKRGFGLHHVAVDVENPKAFVLSMGAAGWLLHPNSLNSQARTVFYLVRPGVGAAIEVQQLRDAPPPARAFITRVEIPCEPALTKLPGALATPGVSGCNGATAIWVGNEPLPLSLLLS